MTISDSESASHGGEYNFFRQFPVILAIETESHEIGERLEETATAVKEMLNMLQSLVSRIKSGEGFLIRNFPTTVRAQELISGKENQFGVMIQVYEDTNTSNHDNNYLGDVNDFTEDEIVGDKLKVNITDNKGGEGIQKMYQDTTTQDQELISVKENQPDMPNPDHESKHPRDHDNNYLGELNNTTEDEIVGLRNATAIPNDDCRLSKEKFNRLLQEEIRHKIEMEEHKKKVKMKLQRQEHEVCLRKGEMYKAHKMFDEMTEMFLKHSFFKNCKDVEILVKNVRHKERFKKNKIAFGKKKNENGNSIVTKNEITVSNGNSKLSEKDTEKIVQDTTIYKAEDEEHKKKVKMKDSGSITFQLSSTSWQQHVHQNLCFDCHKGASSSSSSTSAANKFSSTDAFPQCLHALSEFQRKKFENFPRKEEMADVQKLFDEMPEKNTIQDLGSLWIFCYISSQVIESSPQVAIVGLLGELVTEDGRQYSWGRGMFGRVDNGSESDELFPIPIKIGDSGNSDYEKLKFVDNFGADIILEMLLLTMELLKRGTEAILVANSLNVLNDVTVMELPVIVDGAAKHCDILHRAAEAGGSLVDAMINTSDGSKENSPSVPLMVVENGCGSPCIDLRQVSFELAADAKDANNYLAGV